VLSSDSISFSSGTSTTATSDKPSKPSTGNDLPGECVKLLAELANAPARRDLDQRKGKVQAQFDAADAADDFLLVAKLGMQLQQLEKESAQLPLSEEDYLTLADRHAALVQRVTDQCKELKVAKDFVALAAVAEHLGALKAVDISALPHTCDGKYCTLSLYCFWLFNYTTVCMCDQRRVLTTFPSAAHRRPRAARDDQCTNPMRGGGRRSAGPRAAARSTNYF
jgi:hypothetical protein